MSADSERICYLSRPESVSMGDAWYEIAGLDHFWIVRRFEVLRGLADRLIAQAESIAEVGCGHGLLQRQVEDVYHREVTGFDLNEVALKQTASRTSPVCCYNVLEKRTEYENRFDLIFLFDVLEHISDVDTFVSAVQFHLAPKGQLLINVPALQSLYGAYDRAVGHVRRYNIASLSTVAEHNGMTVKRCSYWGMPLLPLLLLRTISNRGQSQERIIATGLDSRGPVMNRLLLRLSRCEPLPQRLLGTSLMAIFEKSSA